MARLPYRNNTCINISVLLIQWIQVLFRYGSLSGVTIRAGLRHVRGVRPNRAAEFRWAANLDPKIPYKYLPIWTTLVFKLWHKLQGDSRCHLSLQGLAFVLSFIAMLTKEPEMPGVSKGTSGDAKCVTEILGWQKRKLWGQCSNLVSLFSGL